MAEVTDGRRVVQASEILDKIQKGEPVEYHEVTIKGDLDLSEPNLPIQQLEEAKLVASLINITYTEIDGGLNFSNVIFQRPIIFKGSKFNGEAIFRKTTFSGDVNFRGATFNGPIKTALGWSADFKGAIFSNDANFRRATFTRHAIFEEIAFGGNADFGEASFGHAYFRKVTFSGYADFIRSTFKHADFGEAAFSDANFNITIFSENADFRKTAFSENVYFNEATFGGDADFRKATFSKDVNFRKATLGHSDFIRATFKHSDFRKVTFREDVNFSGAAFIENAYFSEAVFSKDADFKKATFNRNANFIRATFGHADFRKVIFSGNAGFRKAIFNEDANFNRATFEHAYFRKATFNEYTNFSEATFEHANFVRTTFEHANFIKSRFNGEASFADSKFLGESLTFEDVAFKNPKDQEDACCRARRVLEESGRVDKANYHFFREMVAKRLQKEIKPSDILQNCREISNNYFDYEMLLFGDFPVTYMPNLCIVNYIKYNIFEYIFVHKIFRYGTNPYTVMVYWISIAIILGFLYFLGQGVEKSQQNISFFEYFYFSIITAATPGYGGYTPKPGIYTIIAGVEAIFGVFMWGAFIATFTRKYMR